MPQGKTQYQILSANTQHKERFRLWWEQQIIIKALKNQLTGSIDKKYIADLYHQYTGYNNSSIQDILEYLYDNYGDLNKENLKKIYHNIKLPYDPLESFGVLLRG